MQKYFYTIDLVLGLALPVFIHLRNRTQPDGAFIIKLFWLGVGIGLTWEVPLFFSAIFAEEPVVGFLREPPLHPLVFMVAHSFWDGGIFLVGLGLVGVVCSQPVLTSFRWRELGVLIVWGQLSEFAVEAASIFNEGWVYSDSYSWNPVLFRFDGHPVTLVPQLIWLAAPVVYYSCVLRLVRIARADELDAPVE